MVWYLIFLVVISWYIFWCSRSIFWYTQCRWQVWYPWTNIGTVMHEPKWSNILTYHEAANEASMFNGTVYRVR